MNSTFKISALAVLVSISVTGCHSYKDNSPIKEPTVINKQDNIKKPVQPEKKPTQSKPEVKPEQPKPEVKPEQPKPEVKPEQPKPEVKPEQPKPEVKPEPQITQKGKSVTANELPEAQLSQIISVDSQNNKWRIVKMNGYKVASSNRIGSYEDYYSGTELITRDDNVCGGYTCEGNAMKYNSGVNNITTFDLTELAQKDGKPFLGVHSGSFTDNDFSGHVIDAYINEKGKLVTTKEDAKTVNYLFVNQPYSSYGMLYTNQNDIVSFSQGLSAGEQVGDYTEFDVYSPHIAQGQKTDKIIWNDNVKGNATYKGEVIATVATYEQPDFDKLRHIPKIDGTITLNAQFGDSWERTYITNGELDSKTIGKIALPRANISSSLTVRGGISKDLNNYTHLAGSYNAKFVGKDLNDVIGQINLSKNHYNLNKGSVIYYNAVFGATKQPK